MNGVTIAETVKREQLKKELAIAAIENYDMDAYNSGMTTIAEDIMKQLEKVNHWENPVHHPELNARWVRCVCLFPHEDPCFFFLVAHESCSVLFLHIFSHLSLLEYQQLECDLSLCFREFQ